ncbi:unnamed protein product [Brassica rapa]|uniref:Uncharacterized protein n=1 Tax=Brassica campestris TaxID=3711 RepID=A0A8D9D0G3_BRACM|nr:unnamed protein product [Brassica rapa]
MSPLLAWRRLSQFKVHFLTQRLSTTITSAFNQIPKSLFELSTKRNARLNSTAFSPTSIP